MNVAYNKETDFLKTYVALLNRLSPFENKTDFETIKTVTNAKALLRRAELIFAGAKPDGRFGFTSGASIETLSDRARNYIEALERGEYPLKGKFCPPGFWVADHSVVAEGDTLHLFFNKHEIGYEWSESPCRGFGHAVTENLSDWRFCPDIMLCENDSFDFYQAWSPSLVKRGNKYYMLYTGVNYNMAQAVCLAQSSDLYNWTKISKDPVYVPGDWCPWHKNKWSDCRDNFVLERDGKFINYFCTKRKTAGGGEEMCIGIAESDNLMDWQDKTTFRLSGMLNAPESPFVLERGGKYYFFYTNCGLGTCYAISDNPYGGFIEAGELMVNKDCFGEAFVPSCAEVFRFKGQWYITVAERLPGNEQYIEIKKLVWQSEKCFVENNL